MFGDTWQVGIKLPPIGHNEIIGPSSSLQPASNLNFLATLHALDVDHAARACWTDSVTGQSPCNVCPTRCRPIYTAPSSTHCEPSSTNMKYAYTRHASEMRVRIVVTV